MPGPGPPSGFSPPFFPFFCSMWDEVDDPRDRRPISFFFFFFMKFVEVKGRSLTDISGSANVFWMLSRPITSTRTCSRTICQCFPISLLLELAGRLQKRMGPLMTEGLGSCFPPIFFATLLIPPTSCYQHAPGTTPIHGVVLCHSKVRIMKGLHFSLSFFSLVEPVCFPLSLSGSLLQFSPLSCNFSFTVRLGFL